MIVFDELYKYKILDEANQQQEMLDSVSSIIQTELSSTDAQQMQVIVTTEGGKAGPTGKVGIREVLDQGERLV